MESGHEVDFVIEGTTGKLVGIEVKARSSVTAGDFSGLESLKEMAGKDSQEGIVLYTGKNVLPFGSHMTAVPITALLSPI